MLFAPKEKGQGLVEYALILVLVAVVVIAVLTLLGPIIGNVFSRHHHGNGWHVKSIIGTTSVLSFVLGISGTHHIRKGGN